MLLEARDLSISLRGPEGNVTIVDHVSFTVDKGEAIALVGESGSGKSLLAHAIMALPPAGARVISGTVFFEDRDLYKMRDRDLSKLRGGAMSIVFQEPSSALNPVYTIGAQILEAIHLHESVSRREARARAIEWLAHVGMPRPDHAMTAYPHELSGGMKQRALLAMALVTKPQLLIADEPTASLDRTLMAQVLERIAHERETRQMAVLLISHDLSAVAELADRTLVMYAGEIVEHGQTLAVLADPQHPYTQGLLASIPDPEQYPSRKIGSQPRQLPVLHGAPPVFNALPVGCRFAPRCEHAFDRCRKERPPLYALDGGSRVARCFLLDPKNLDDNAVVDQPASTRDQQ